MITYLNPMFSCWENVIAMGNCLLLSILVLAFHVHYRHVYRSAHAVEQQLRVHVEPVCGNGVYRYCRQLYRPPYANAHAANEQLFV